MQPEVCVRERETQPNLRSSTHDDDHKRKLILCLTTEVIKPSHMCMSSSPNLGQTYSQIKQKTGGHQPRKFWNYFPPPPPPPHHHHHHHHSCEGMMSQEKRPGTSNWRHMTTESKPHTTILYQGAKNTHSLPIILFFLLLIEEQKFQTQNEATTTSTKSHQAIGAPFNGMHA